MEPIRLLIADDDTELCELLASYLAEEGFEVETVHDGRAAVDRGAAAGFDVIVLDVMMPELNGLDALRELRTRTQTPVLMLTARGDEVDRIVGLELGADDYLPKPCNPRELSARLRAIVRRARLVARPGEPGGEVLCADDVELRPGAREALLAGAPLELTAAEFGVLEALLRQRGEMVSKEALTEHALSRKLTRHDRSIDVHVSNLRRKLGPAPGGRVRIKTIRGAGYLYTAPGYG